MHWDCHFFTSIAKIEQLRPSDQFEIAFWGRSNVGKSTLINCLCGKKQLARVSNTPGRTQMLNFFHVNNKFFFVDLPGYGYASAPLHIIKEWEELTYTYLTTRSNLRIVYLLIDASVGFKKNDLEKMSVLDRIGLSYKIILTKTDKTNEKKLEGFIKDTQEEIKKHPACLLDIWDINQKNTKKINFLKEKITDFLFKS